ncbi:DUF4232 domain-containing protein [Streptomyces sp. NPDC044780]|uniref:DUF4232 domain-containing protein n=1 Tax=unclassified Streptomyces TaxID=2593676 RepID=UPI00340B6B0C
MRLPPATPRRWWVVLKNTGSTDCSMVGFPGVQIRIAHGGTWDLQRTNDWRRPPGDLRGPRVGPVNTVE